MNKTIFQYFHWYIPSNAVLWNEIDRAAPKLAEIGITHVWLPPAYKSGRGMEEPGYAVYDLFDLGEFDQKGSVRTKHGTKAEYINCINTLHKNNIAVLADIVLNHRIDADEAEEVLVHKVDENDRNEKIGEPFLINIPSRFVFPGRKGKYSEYIWDCKSFTGVCMDDSIYLVHNEHTNGNWDDVMEKQFGNYDYLLGCDVEFRNPSVREELKKWGKWYVETAGIDGFRLDAVKHISVDFFPEWISFLSAEFNKEFFCVGEYWKNDVEPLLQYIDATNASIQLFDVPLHFNFKKASYEGVNFDLRTIFDNTLVSRKPELSVTFVDNHDTQPLQSLESWVQPWFKWHCYAMILLREQGIPCVFYPDLYGARYTDVQDEQQKDIQIEPVADLEKLMKLRQTCTYSHQTDYFNTSNLIGWTRAGAEDVPDSGCAVVLTNAGEGAIRMCMGEQNANRQMFCVVGNILQDLFLNEKGEADFSVQAGGISVWLFRN